jgi:hypothetical protein
MCTGNLNLIDNIAHMIPHSTGMRQKIGKKEVARGVRKCFVTRRDADCLSYKLTKRSFKSRGRAKDTLSWATLHTNY